MKVRTYKGIVDDYPKIIIVLNNVEKAKIMEITRLTKPLLKQIIIIKIYNYLKNVYYDNFHKYGFRRYKKLNKAGFYVQKEEVKTVSLIKHTSWVLWKGRQSPKLVAVGSNPQWRAKVEEL